MFSIDKIIARLPTGFLTVLLLGLGAVSYYIMPVRTLPELSAPGYLIEISSPGLTPQEFDKLIGSELEQGLLTLPCRRDLHSRIRASTAQFRYIFRDGCQESKADLKERIVEILETQKGIWPPYTEVRKSEFIDPQNKWEYLLEGADTKDSRLRPWIKKLVAELRSVEGVKDVQVDIDQPYLDVALDEVALQHKGLDASSVAAILRDHMKDRVIGVSSKSGQNFQFTLQSPISSDKTDLESLTLRSEPELIKLGEVASVRHRMPYQEFPTLFNGKPGFFLYITEAQHSDYFKLKSEVAEVLEKAIANYPTKLSYKIMFDNAKFMGDQLKSIGDNAIVGVLTMLVFIGFVMGFRAAFAQLFSTPVIVASTLLVMWITGQTLNLLCIMGMFIVLGIMVDDSVIVSETYMQWRRKGLPPQEATSRTARSLILPLITTFLAVSASLLPVFFWNASASEYMRPIAIIFIAALGLSLIECLTLLPAHLQKLDKEGDISSSLRERVWTRFGAFYRSCLSGVIRLRWLLAPLIIGLMAYGVFLVKDRLRFNSSFGYNGERVTFHYHLGSMDHQDLARLTDGMSTDVLVSIQRLGFAEKNGKKVYGPAYGQISFVVLGSTENMVETKQNVFNEVTRRLEKADGLAWFEAEKSNEVSKQENVLSTPLYISGDTLEKVLTAGQGLEAELRKIPGFVRLIEAEDPRAERWQFAPDYNRLSQAGLSANQVFERVGYQIAPQFLGRIPLMGELTDVRLSNLGYDDMGPDALRTNLSHLQVVHPEHKGVFALAQFGSWTRTISQTTIIKRDGVSSIRLDAEFDQSKVKRQFLFNSLASLGKAWEAKVPSLRVKTDSSEVEQRDEMRTYMIEFGIAAFLVYVLVALTTGSYIRPFILILCLSPIVATVIFALYIHERALSILIFIGVLSVFGISINDGLIILHKIKEIEQEKSIIAAIKEAMLSKFRAIVITGSCAGISLFPIAYSTDDINLFIKPIAFGAMWGLVGSATQALVVLPLLLAIEGDIIALANRIMARCRALLGLQTRCAGDLSPESQTRPSRR
jgi:multidrug efflux pump subunit AcrB